MNGLCPELNVAIPPNNSIILTFIDTMGAYPGIEGEDLEAEWTHLLHLIEVNRLDMALDDLHQRLRAAQGEKDMGAMLALMAEETRLRTRKAELGRVSA